MRVVCLLKPPPWIAEARRKAKLAARKQGRQASAKTLYASEWVILVTSLTQQACSTDEVFQRTPTLPPRSPSGMKSIGLRSPPATNRAGHSWA